MHHTTSIGPVLDENDKPVPGKTFAVKGVVESNNAMELLTADEFAALVADDVEFTRTAGGGFEYSIEFGVSEGRLAQIKADAAAAAAAKAEADKKAAAEQAVSQVNANLELEKAKAFEEGKKAAVLEQARAAGAASVAVPATPATPPATVPPPNA